MSPRLSSSTPAPLVTDRPPRLGQVRIDLSGAPAALPNYVETVVFHNRYLFDNPETVRAIAKTPGRRVFGYFSVADCWDDWATHPEGSFARLWGTEIDSLSGWASLATTAPAARGTLPVVAYWPGGSLVATQKRKVARAYSHIVSRFLREQRLEPSLSGIFIDNVWDSLAHLEAGNPDGIDLDEDGIDEGRPARDALWTAGTRIAIERLRELFPSMILIGNGDGGQEFRSLNGTYIESAGPREVKNQLVALDQARTSIDDSWRQPREVWIQDPTTTSAAVLTASIAAASGEAKISVATQDAYFATPPATVPSWDWPDPGIPDYSSLEASASEVQLDYAYHRTELQTAVCYIYRRSSPAESWSLLTAISR